jgi:hypothetical protein
MLLFLAVAGPLIGAILGIVIGAHERCAWPRVVAGALIGAVLSVIYGMWRVYGAITDAMGLDSLANLVLELVLFAVVGLLAAVAAFKLSALLKRHT